jgi:hypothetical protein
MAGIDRTYTDSYKDYKEFKDWADKQYITFFDGYKVCIGNWVYEWEEEDFSNGEITIMNSPTYIDVYLIQNCKSKIVLDRMKEVYGEDTFNEYKSFDFTKGFPEDYQQNRKISIQRGKRTKFPIHKRPYNESKWWLQCDDYYWYNEETKLWVSWDMYYPHTTNTAHLPTIKSVIRHLRKQHLPKGITFELFGRYVGEEYIIKIN